jgi:O-antigen ligase
MNWSLKIRNDVYYYLHVLIAITLPLPFYAINNGLILLVGATWLVNFYMEPKINIQKSDRMIVFSSLLFLLIYLIGVLYSSNRQDAWISIERKLPMFFLPLIVATSPVIDSVKIKIILSAFLISCSIVTFLCIGYTFWLNKQQGYEFVYWYNFQYSEDNLTRKFGFHHVYFCMYLCFCQAIIFYLFKSTSKIALQVGLSFLSICLLLFMFGLGSRMGVIILILLLMLGIFLFIKNGVAAKLSIAVGVFVLFCAVGYQFPFIREKFTGLLNIDVNEFSVMYKASNRMVSIESTWNIFKNNWIFGVGPGDVNDLLIKEYKRINFQEGVIHTYNPHNQYLDTAASVGIIGLVILLVIVLFPLCRSIKSRDFISLSFALIPLFSFLTESMLSRQKGVVFFTFFLCILNIHRGKKEDSLMKY